MKREDILTFMLVAHELFEIGEKEREFEELVSIRKEPVRRRLDGNSGEI